MRLVCLIMATAIMSALPVFSQDNNTATFPKGTIYYTQKSGKKVNLFSMKSDGSGIKQLTEFGEWEGCEGIDVNAKAKHVVFTYVEKMSKGLGVVDLKSGKVDVLIKPTFDETTDGCALSPDGKKIVVCTGGTFKKKLHVMSVNGSGKKALTKEEALIYRPAWSPNGKLITFNHKPPIKMEGGGASYVNSEILGIKAMGGKTVQLANGDGDFYDAEISSDGKSVVYVHAGVKSKQGNVTMMDSPAIWTMRISGKGKKKISDDKAWDTEPKWSPDGKKIAFISTRSAGYANVFVMNADGSDMKQLSEQDYSKKMMPRWSKDGNFIFYVAEKDYKRKGYVVHVASKETKELLGDCQEFVFLEK